MPIASCYTDLLKFSLNLIYFQSPLKGNVIGGSEFVRCFEKGALWLISARMHDKMSYSSVCSNIIDFMSVCTSKFALWTFELLSRLSVVLAPHIFRSKASTIQRIRYTVWLCSSSFFGFPVLHKALWPVFTAVLLLVHGRCRRDDVYYGRHLDGYSDETPCNTVRCCFPVSHVVYK